MACDGACAAAERCGELPGRYLQGGQWRKARLRQNLLADPGRPASALQQGPIEGTGQVDLAALHPHQAHIAAPTHGHLQHTGRKGGSFSGQNTPGPHPTVGFDLGVYLRLAPQGAVGETRRNQHHLGSDTPARAAFLQHHLPPWL